MNWWALLYNFRRPDIRNPRLREAITLALDRQQLLLDHLGTGDILSGPFTQASPFYDWDVKPRRRDLDRARALAPGPMRLTLLAEAGAPERKALALDIRSQLKQIGITLRVRRLPPRRFDRALEDGEFDIALRSFEFRRYVNLLPLFHTRGERNVGRFSSEVVDTLLDRSRRAKDSEALRKAYQALHAELHRQLPYTFLWSLNVRVGVLTKREDLHDIVGGSLGDLTHILVETPR